MAENNWQVVFVPAATIQQTQNCSIISTLGGKSILYTYLFYLGIYKQSVTSCDLHVMFLCSSICWANQMMPKTTNLRVQNCNPYTQCGLVMIPTSRANIPTKWPAEKCFHYTQLYQEIIKMIGSLILGSTFQLCIFSLYILLN